MTVVLDSTVLHYLILIEHADILPKLFDKLLLPPAVVDELTRSGTPAEVTAWMSHRPAWLAASPLNGDQWTSMLIAVSMMGAGFALVWDSPKELA